MVPILVASILTAAFSGLMWGISTQIRDAIKSARVKQRGNHLKAKMSASDKTKKLAEIDDLQREPEIQRDKRVEILDNQAINVNSANLHANEASRKRDEFLPQAELMEKSGALTIGFVLTDKGTAADADRGLIATAIGERAALAAAGEDTTEATRELRKKAASGLVVEQYEVKPDNPLSGVDLATLERLVKEGNHLNSFVEDALREGLEIRPGKVAKARTEHGFANPDSTSALPPLFLAELGPGRGISTALQNRSGQAPAPRTAPASGNRPQPPSPGRATGS
ncbi:hypothetical protein [Nocardiopsis tropica]|uniref:Secreted protein n=1 Tax=Nocardiopsis tropica TaxID=109330 RepID=A0ABU7KXR1_9ACTN|nr:hypothetical protein [Nocardiopsis umidischolae]MEE2054064.1 hypothetical protein [Nocardiopsis umidischolae]